MEKFKFILSQILLVVLAQTNSPIILHTNPANSSLAQELIDDLKVKMTKNCFFNLDDDEKLNYSLKGLREIGKLSK